jgi:uncharacterized protein YjiS (DUF1127 family)
MTNTAENVSLTPRTFVRQPRAIGSQRDWRAASTFLRTRLGRSAAALAAEFEARRAISHLQSLDDDRLRDLGIGRGDIEQVVRFGREGWNPRRLRL